MILLLAFGTVVSMAIPIVVAIIGVVTGLSAIALLGHLIEVPSVAPTLGTMIGLGVGIDYALFIVTRYRRRLADGLAVEEAIARSAATSGSAVAFAGSTVVIALLSLAFAQIPIVSALGYSAAIVVAVAVLAAHHAAARDPGPARAPGRVAARFRTSPPSTTTTSRTAGRGGPAASRPGRGRR